VNGFTNFAEIPRRHYGAIYADPPWSFRAWSTKGTGRGAEQHYPTLAFDELAAFPVAELAGDRCALFLWVVRSNIPEALRLIGAWEFTFKSTAFIWAKTCTKNPERFRIGFGKWTRTGAEHCWRATRGRKTRNANPRAFVS
jgi:N6-adenosine-specific RNA methylase IME4